MLIKVVCQAPVGTERKQVLELIQHRIDTSGLYGETDPDMSRPRWMSIPEWVDKYNRIDPSKVSHKVVSVMEHPDDETSLILEIEILNTRPGLALKEQKASVLPGRFSIRTIVDQSSSPRYPRVDYLPPALFKRAKG